MDPAKQAAFLAFMLYMSGNTLQVPPLHTCHPPRSPQHSTLQHFQVFSIMMLVSCITMPLAAIANVAKALPRDEDGELSVLLPRATFVAIQAAQFGFAMYKLNSMGLLPTHASDWVSTLQAPAVVQHALGGAF